MGFASRSNTHRKSPLEAMDNAWPQRRHVLSKSSITMLFLFSFGLACTFQTSIGPNSQRKVSLWEHTNDERGTCVNVLPYAKMHDTRPDEIAKYQHKLSSLLKGRKLNRSLPELVTLPAGTNFAFWDCPESECREVASDKIVRGSVWGPDGKDLVDSPLTWRPHQDYEHKIMSTSIVAMGDSVAYMGFQYTSFGHIIHDSLPSIAWLHEVLPDHTTFILPDTPMMRHLIAFIDASLIDRIVWAFPNQMVSVVGGTLTVSVVPDEYTKTVFTSGLVNHVLFPYYRRWLRKSLPTHYPTSEKHIVFHTRSGSTPRRVLEETHEQDVIETIQRAMKRHGRKEDLFIFNGKDSNGETLPLKEQFRIFRKASSIIGPHGSGLANVIWTDPFPKSCKDRVSLLEFIPGSDSAIVQSNNTYNGYYWVLGGMPIDWHQLTYSPNSTATTTWIRLPDLERALDDMWGSRK